ncbi:tigger transposable element-derived protein 1-like [Euwallacea similis]|uniref:tigger transposable element-derived protein 1-like n=1 Tax=Euwallacea similis TaxID=1736056 RepID=UPI00344F1A4C
MKGESASADSSAAQQYPAKFAEIIAANFYTPYQVFNADEFGLFWKKMPERTYLAKAHESASGHKAAKNRKNIKNLPVYWMASKKAWVTAIAFNAWFHNFFIPDVKSYLSKKGLPFKALLLIDNAPGHPPDLQHDNIRGILDILDTQIIKSTINACWKAIWPDAVESENDKSPLEHECSQIIQLAHTIGGEGFENLAEADIEEIMADEELNEDELVNMIHETNKHDEKYDSDEEQSEPVAFTARVISVGLEMGKKLSNHFLQYDTNVERALRFQRDLSKCLNQYEEVYKNLAKKPTQLLITDFTTKSCRSEIFLNSSTIKPESHEEISSDESHITPIKKKRLIVLESDDSN